MPDLLRSQQGHLVFETTEWELIDLSVTDYFPGRPFKIACNTPGYARVVGSGMKQKGAANTQPIPIFEGFNAYVCSMIYRDAALESPAADMVALFI